MIDNGNNHEGNNAVVERKEDVTKTSKTDVEVANDVAIPSAKTTTTTTSTTNIMASLSSPPPRPDGVLLTCLLAFRIYDGYQWQNTLTRDTLQRFLSDIHGEDSYNTAAVKGMLDMLFFPPPTLDGDARGEGLASLVVDVESVPNSLSSLPVKRG